MTTHPTQDPAALAADIKQLAALTPKARKFSLVRHLQLMNSLIDHLAALASQAREAAEVPAGGWINAADQMPPPGKPVLVVYTTHHTPPRERINRAHWIPAKFEEAGSESDNFEYDEDTDTDYTPAGWYECIDHWDEYSAVAMAGVTVTRWMPLPSLSSVPPAPAAVVRVPLTDEQIERFADHAADRIPESNYVGRVLHAVRMAEAALNAAPPAADAEPVAVGTCEGYAEGRPLVRWHGPLRTGTKLYTAPPTAESTAESGQKRAT